MVKNPNFSLGQRWISDTESNLGLGVITDCEGRHISIVFPASEEKRIYACDNAPLTRVAYKPGDTITSHENWQMVVKSINETAGYITYIGQRTDNNEPCQLGEVDLTSFANFNHPKDRLFSAQIDGDNWFQLRSATLKYLKTQQSLNVRGLMASRTNLIPHQLYIANEVANRFAPRVLLADEVGLGKTIEAGLILSKQLLTGMATRVLIIVPDSLVHQWLVEMLRRFNLRFSVFDEERCNAIATSMAEAGNTVNPFDSEQLVLCGLSLFVDSPALAEQAAQTHWDICVVDEAHHLEWNANQSSIEYQVVEKIAQRAQGLLLLTATPEQLGLEGHFARLRLLDPNRFPDLKQFIDEQQRYSATNQLVQNLNSAELITHFSNSHPIYQQLIEYLGDDGATQLLDCKDDAHAFSVQAEELTRLLIDRHGTSRLLYRNTRAAIEGFPARNVTAYSLSLPHEYAANQSNKPFDISALTPEHNQTMASINWCATDPRVSWLAEFLQNNSNEKVLVICHHSTTALVLEEHLRLKVGLKTAVFHEDLTLINRDRAAAYFADLDDGAQTLICSEIGSEGRNFQFACHLVMFDLPLIPDLLEQRIGRLDRIGQNRTIQVHIPYFIDSPQHALFRWYHEGLNAFSEVCNAGPTIFAELGAELIDVLSSADCHRLEKLISHTKSRVSDINTMLDQGRNQLLEMHSFDKTAALTLIDDIINNEQSHLLKRYMERVFLQYGLNYEDLSSNCYSVRPGEHMSVPHFPELPEDGLTITYSRQTALTREDIPLITWEHPMVVGSMDMILNGEKGNTSLITINNSPFEAGSLLVETLFTLSCIAPPNLQIGRYLPITLIRILMNTNGDDISTVMDAEAIDLAARKVKRHLRQEVVKHQRDLIEKLLDRSCELATEKVPAVKTAAVNLMLTEQTKEIKRLVALKAVNPNIRDEEIEFLKQQTLSIHEHINNAQFKMEAIRVIVPT